MVISFLTTLYRERKSKKDKRDRSMIITCKKKTGEHSVSIIKKY